MIHLRPWRLSYGYIYSGDDQGYLAHLSTVVIDRDLSYANERAPLHYPPGSSWLSLPGYTVGYLLDAALDNRVALLSDRNYSYTWTIVWYLFNQQILVVLGLIFLWKLFRSLGIDNTAALLAVLSVMGSHLALYAFRRPLSHDGEFFLSVAFLTWWVRCVQRPRKIQIFQSLWGGVISGALLATRWNDVQFLALASVPFAIWIIRSYSGKEKFPPWKIIQSAFAYGFSTLSSFILLQGPVWWGQFHTLCPSLNAISPAQARLEQPLSWESVKALAHIIWGLDFGLLWTSPIIVLGLCAGAVFSFSVSSIIFPEIKRPAALGLMVLTCLGVYGLGFLIVMQWRTQGSYYGYRYLTCTLAASALFAALWMNEKIRSGHRRGIVLAGALLILTGTITAIPFEGNSSTLTLSIGVTKSGLSGWINPSYSLEAWKNMISPLTLARALTAGPLGVPVGLYLRRNPQTAPAGLEKLIEKYEPFNNLSRQLYLLIATALLMSPAGLFLRYCRVEENNVG